MILKYNGFALKPTRCRKCDCVFWLERYRKEESYNLFKGKIEYKARCKRCVESEEKQ